MNPEIKQKWVAALRSGKYVQGKGTLKRNNEDGTAKYCCLGVICQELNIVNKKMKDLTSFDGCIGILSQRIRELTGVLDLEMNVLTNMNDAYGKSFSQIADYIEANL